MMSERMSVASLEKLKIMVQQSAHLLRKPARAALEAGLERSWLRSHLFWRLQTPVNGVCLTFDDGPDPQCTPRVLEILARYHARATFFVVGRQVLEHPELARRIIAEGHTLGNHTFSHVRCDRMTAKEFRREVEEGDAAIEALREGESQPIFRPPFGAIRPAQLCELLRDGRHVALWNRDPRDYQFARPEEIVAVGEKLQSRDIVLLHDRFPATLEALPKVLEGLARRGLTTVVLQDPAARNA
jgi:peptidoglycan-N-acetylglucosamine deacetylase